MAWPGCGGRASDPEPGQRRADAAGRFRDQATENDHLLIALRDRQALLERLAGDPALDRGAARASRDLRAGDPGRARSARRRRRRRRGCGISRAAGRRWSASLGVSKEFLAARNRTNTPGARDQGDRRGPPGRLRQAHRHSCATCRANGRPRACARDGGARVRARRGRRRLGNRVARSEPRRTRLRDQQVMLALAEHTSLALNHARALDDVVHQAFHDSLTGMPNRALFIDRIAHALARADGAPTAVGVLFVDLDDFKTDQRQPRPRGRRRAAHPGRRAAREQCLRPARHHRAARRRRVRGPARGLGDADERRAVGRRASSRRSRSPFSVDGREVFVNAQHRHRRSAPAEAETLLRDADLAMYRAKADGKGRYEASSPAMHTEIMERLELEVELKRRDRARRAGARLPADLQPPDGRDRRPGGAGPLAPSDARPVPAGPRSSRSPRRSGRIDDLGRWVLAAACHQGALWRAKYPALPGIQVGVNVSAAQLQEPELVRTVAGALETARLDPEGLTLEITETALMDDFDAAVRRLGELKDLGIEIAVDDFGTGHSSLRYLQRLPIDNLKIAKPFVDEIASPESKPPILRAVLDLADVFNLRPVAEGIERAEQARAAARARLRARSGPSPLDAGARRAGGRPDPQRGIARAAEGTAGGRGGDAQPTRVRSRPGCGELIAIRWLGRLVSLSRTDSEAAEVATWISDCFSCWFPCSSQRLGCSLGATGPRSMAPRTMASPPRPVRGRPGIESAAPRRAVASINRPRAVVWAVGDGGTDSPQASRLASSIARAGADRLLYLGDVYPEGTRADFEENYAPNYGRLAAQDRADARKPRRAHGGSGLLPVLGASAGTRRCLPITRSASRVGRS